MLQKEFEQMTGIYPTIGLYQAIEARYGASKMKKDEFCRLYKENEDGLAESIQYEVNRELICSEERQKKEIRKRDMEIDFLEKQIKSLGAELDKVRGWEKYECSRMSQEDYDALKAQMDTDIFGQAKAAVWVSEEFGFEYGKIRVCFEIPEYQKSRDGDIRKCGTVDRLPVYNATDWNYIRFDVVGWQWEVVNGQLYQYND